MRKRSRAGFEVGVMAGGSNGSNESNLVCRDFLRNVCHRGKRCKYLHERSEDDPNEEYTFCHDFQNGVCNWPDCKFIHCSESEEKHFRTTGELPAHIQARFKNNVDKSDYPVCKNFIKGACQRVNCKFRHYRIEEPQHNVPLQPHVNPPRSQPQNFNGTITEDRRYEEDRRCVLLSKVSIFFL